MQLEIFISWCHDLLDGGMVFIINSCQVEQTRQSMCQGIVCFTVELF